MTDRIHLPDAASQGAALVLYGETALRYCVRMTTDDGQLYLTADRPVLSLSSGERLLWDAMDDMAQGRFPVMDTGTLDGPNTVALMAAIGTWASERVTA